ncbi:MAG: hydantoinase B/oxoprolinase family protein, partial [Acidobacteria bacterium]|nr:hydantoinase B/oxoprolinase family protein [Acidobacteriota bacterium]
VAESAGAGRWRGGTGIVREYEMLEDCMVTVRGSNHRHAAWGLGRVGGRDARAILRQALGREVDPEARGEIEAALAAAGL